MFIIVAIHAEVFPVRSVRRIVVMIAVFVVYGEQVPVFNIEFSGTFGTNEPMNPQGLFPIGVVA